MVLLTVVEEDRPPPTNPPTIPLAMFPTNPIVKVPLLLLFDVLSSQILLQAS